MKCLKLTFALFFALTQIVSAQVKKTYQDTNNAATTIVVKENDADDYEVLENNFDIDEYGIGQVIRITTEADKPKQEVAKLNNEPKPINQVQEVVLNPQPNRASQPKEITQQRALEEVASLKENAPVLTTTPKPVAVSVNDIEIEKEPATTTSAIASKASSKKVMNSKRKVKRVKNNSRFQRKKFRIRINLRIFKGGKGSKCYSF